MHFTFKDVSTQHAWSFSSDDRSGHPNRTPPDRFSTPTEHRITLEAEGDALKRVDFTSTTSINGTMNDDDLKQLSWHEFDQTPGKYWRELADVRRFKDAALLIRRYLNLHPELEEGLQKLNGRNLHFHAAQCWAFSLERGDEIPKDCRLAAIYKHLDKAAHGPAQSEDGLLWKQ